MTFNQANDHCLSKRNAYHNAGMPENNMLSNTSSREYLLSMWYWMVFDIRRSTVFVPHGVIEQPLITKIFTSCLCANTDIDICRRALSGSAHWEPPVILTDLCRYNKSLMFYRHDRGAYSVKDSHTHAHTRTHTYVVYIDNAEILVCKYCPGIYKSSCRTASQDSGVPGFVIWVVFFIVGRHFDTGAFGPHAKCQRDSNDWISICG